MDISAIAGTAIEMNLMKTQQSVNIALTDKVLENSEQQATKLISDFSEAQPKAPGHLLDIKI